MMPAPRHDPGGLHYRVTGPEGGLTLVLSGTLGSDLRVWEPLLPCLPQDIRVLRYDHRGHGESLAPDGPYTMGQLVRDTETLLDHLRIRGAVFLGQGLGGLVAQALATKRPDLLRAMVLSGTGARLDTAELWGARAQRVRTQGLPVIAEQVLKGWFTPAFQRSPAISVWRDMLFECPPQGWAGCAQAIAGSDFYATTARLALPVLGLTGDRDALTPPDLVRETTELVAGSQFAILRRAGHLAHVEQPEEFSRLVTGFLCDCGFLARGSY
ncbi:3-oxoadipate enol-lactonase [Roseinatronobacter alkalisoli]|uniref:3-oxoadipate enol-lactonase n=1 Tax=Roseinatronobacter alkalisoli TaxID=3028235 RepID=A0ABT5TCL4_9RHOB|nr:3-oxoadipate enol-lactonase [Roseinatronobacter sp. HJB301]MDD7971658.1 3-oxoadipate enol-lactonase [Roseinatronobacter sp. HJB301]